MFHAVPLVDIENQPGTTPKEDKMENEDSHDMSLTDDEMELESNDNFKADGN